MNPVLNQFLHPQAIVKEPVLPRLPGRFEKAAMQVNEMEHHERFENRSKDSPLQSADHSIRETPQEKNKPVESHPKYNQGVIIKTVPVRNNSQSFRHHELSSGNEKINKEYPAETDKKTSANITSSSHFKNQKKMQPDSTGELNTVMPVAKSAERGFFEKNPASRQNKTQESNTKANQNNSTPTIKITIGRIELRATTPSPPQQPQRPSQKPRLALEDLLKSNQSAGS